MKVQYNILLLNLCKKKILTFHVHAKFFCEPYFFVQFFSKSKFSIFGDEPYYTRDTLPVE